MYDQFHVNLEDARFLVGHNIKTTMEQLYSTDRSTYVLDTFNLGLLLGISIIPDAQNLARIRIRGDVPKVALAINDFQYKTLMQIIDVAIPNTDFESSDSSSIFNAFGNNRGIEDVDIEDSTQPISKPNAPTNKDQHQFEFDLNVKLVQISLSRCIDAVTLQTEPLAEIVGESMALNFYKTLADMYLTLSVFDISLLDHIEKSGVPEFQKLVSSNSEGEKKNLLEMKYSRKQRLVMFKNKEIEVFDQDVDMQIAVVKFVVTRKSYLSLLNFVLNTFTDPNAPATPADELINASSSEDTSPQKINVNVALESIIIVLNEDGIKLATLQLSSAEVKVFLLPDTMDIQGKLGAFALHDEVNQGSPRDSLIRNLIHIDGDNLAQFSYKAYDNVTQNKPSVVEFETGAITINFIEASFNRILAYLSQFLKMKAIYDSARQAAINQSAQLPAQLLFNVLIHAPTIVFPFVNHNTNKLVANLGEIYAHNQYKDSSNTIQVGIRNVNVMSHLEFENDIKQDLHMVDDLDISFDIAYSEKYVKDVPTFVVRGKMPELDLHLTEIQLKMLTQLSDSVNRAFTFDDSDSNLQDVEEDAVYANEVLRHNTQMIHAESPQQSAAIVSPDTEDTDIPGNHKMVDLKFDVPRVALTIYNGTSSTTTLKDYSLSSLQ